ncbi:MAG: pyridoxine 5'-phosphate synthase [bacterium]
MAKLCVNIDHVATIRQARMDIVPNPVDAAMIVEKAGADGITVHLREDRRHINDKDVEKLKKIVKKKFNLEMSLSADIVKKALSIVPDEVTLVPEKRQELTTEGGLNVLSNFKLLKTTITKFNAKKIPVSLFIEANAKQIQAAKEVGAAYIEIHTGKYANAKTAREEKLELERIKAGTIYAQSLGLKVNAGHGLTYKNAGKIAAIKGIEDLNIGHNIIARAVMVGMDRAVKEMLKAIKG